MNMLDVAFEDLKASETLYKQGHFPQSLFFLQQSVEKTIKFVGLENGTITPKQMRNKIGHDGSKLFQIILRAFPELTDGDSPSQLAERFRQIKVMIQSKDMNEISDFTKGSIAELKENVKSMNLASSFPPSSATTSILAELDIPEDDKKAFEEAMKNDEFRNSMEKRSNEFMKTLGPFIEAGMSLFCITFMVDLFEASSRYPDIESFERPSDKFNQNSNLVLNLPWFHEEMKGNIKAILRTVTLTKMNT